MVQIATLVSGSSGNALLATDGHTHLLVDAGLSFRRLTAALKTFDLTPVDLSAVILTHEHSDHISGLPMLARHTDLPIFASAGTARALVQSVPSLADCLRGFAAGSAFSVGGIEIESFSTPHDSADSVGYALHMGGIKASVATDLGEMTEEIMACLKGSDFLLLESNHDVELLRDGRYPAFLKRRILGRRGHLSNADCARAIARLRDSGTKHVVLGHLSEQNNRPELAYDEVAGLLSRERLMTGLALHVAPRAAVSPVFSV